MIKVFDRLQVVPKNQINDFLFECIVTEDCVFF